MQPYACLYFPAGLPAPRLASLAEACLGFSSQIALRDGEAVLLETGRSRWLYSQASLGLRLERLAPAVYDGDFDAAARAAQALIALDPKNADAYMALGILDWHRGRVDECLANLRQALALDPSRDYLKAIIQRTEAR
jgi:tetratricopeptide (TPR) repeat protein